MNTKKVITIVKDKVDMLETRLINSIRPQINETCRELVYTLFSDKRDKKTVSESWGYMDVNTLGGEIKERVIKAALEKFNERYKELTKEVIEGEEFIDKIIERVNRKQLNKGR